MKCNIDDHCRICTHDCFDDSPAHGACHQVRTPALGAFVKTVKPRVDAVVVEAMFARAERAESGEGFEANPAFFLDFGFG